MTATEPPPVPRRGVRWALVALYGMFAATFVCGALALFGERVSWVRWVAFAAGFALVRGVRTWWASRRPSGG